MPKQRTKSRTWYRILKKENQKLLKEVFQNKQKNKPSSSNVGNIPSPSENRGVEVDFDCDFTASISSDCEENNTALDECEARDDDMGLDSSFNNFRCTMIGQDKNILINNERTDQVKLKQWAISNNITHTALDSLFSILSNASPGSFSSLPKSSRTFLKTPTNLQTKEVEPGEYYHFGIKKSLEFLFQKLKLTPSSENIQIGINIDGLPLAKSSNSQVYPILGMLIPSKDIFMIGIYHGYEKPRDFNKFLLDFVNEATYLTINGIKIFGKLYTFKVVMYLFDAVAKSSVLQIKSHAGYSSCTKCTQEGEYVEDRICFPGLTFNERTHLDFVNQTDSHHHKGSTILLNIPDIDIIKDIPLDYMHLVLLGVVKKLLSGFWCSGRPPHKLSGKQIDQISRKLEQLHSHIPSEFARVPRSLNEVKRWKATEFRQFLLYTGPLVLKSVLPKRKYLNFLTLSVAITLLSNDSLCKEYVDYAESLLIFFVKTVKNIYGDHLLTHNFHNLLHLANDVRKFGTLENFSNFSCENFLQSLLKLVRKPEKPLQQIIRRYYENSNICINPPTDHETHSKKIVFKNFKLSTHNIKDSSCVLKDGSIVIITDIIFSPEKQPVNIVGQKYDSVASFFNFPCSSSLLKIFFVEKLNNDIHQWAVEDIDYKVVSLPHQNGFVIFPLIHAS